MRNSDLIARIACGVELVAIMFNMLMSFLYFISLIWVLIGLFWGLVGFFALLQGVVALFVIIRGYTPISLAAPILGLMISMFNFNLFAGAIEMMVLALLVVGLVVRGQEDAVIAAETPK